MQDTDKKIREFVEGYAGVGDNEEDRAPAHADAVTDQRRADRQLRIPLPVDDQQWAGLHGLLDPFRIDGWIVFGPDDAGTAVTHQKHAVGLQVEIPMSFSTSVDAAQLPAIQNQQTKRGTTLLVNATIHRELETPPAIHHVLPQATEGTQALPMTIVQEDANMLRDSIHFVDVKRCRCGHCLDRSR